MTRFSWIIVVLPLLSFFVILLFGKRLPRHGSEVGIAAVGASFVLSCIAVVQWINRVEDATGAHALGALGKSVAAATTGEHGAVVAPVVH